MMRTALVLTTLLHLICAHGPGGMHGGMYGGMMPWRRVWPGPRYGPMPPYAPPMRVPAEPPAVPPKEDQPAPQTDTDSQASPPPNLPPQGAPEHAPLPDGWQSPNYPHPPRVPSNGAFGVDPERPCLLPSARGLGGKATYYTEWSYNPGSCGYIPGYDNIVAVAPQHMPHSCGRCILVRCGGRAIKAVVTDTCEACAANTKWIDLSSNMFSRFAPHDVGVLQVDWDFVEC